MQFKELKAMGNLPSPSHVAMEIMRLTQKEDVSIDELVRQIKPDPALTGQLLKIANSAFFGQNPVVSVKDAIMRLGTQILSRLALSLSLLNSDRSCICPAFDYDRFWSTSLLRGLAMQAIAAHDRIIAPEEAFTIGLLAEIGQLALAQTYPLEYSHCLQNITGNLLEHEQIAFAIDHDQITLAMLEDWGLPERVTGTVHLFQQWNANRLDCNACNAGLSVQTEKLANHLKLASLLAGDHDLNAALHIDFLLDNLAISTPQLDTLKKQLLLDWCDWGSFLLIPTTEIPEVFTENNPAPEQTLPVKDYAGLRIFLVEDDKIQRHVLSHYLAGKGHQVTTAENGAQALESMMTSNPQLVITDYKMESMDGLTLCRTMRKNNQTHNIYVILITADNDLATMPEAFTAGVNDFIRKPIAHNELDARILGAQNAIRLQTEKNKEQDHICHQTFDLASSNRRMEMLATTDMLTSLSNRRHAVTRLDQEWEIFKRYGRPFSLLSLDLDRFKQLNDSFGHATGDQVLVHFANILRQSIRRCDSAYRMGGEEFLIILPNTDYSTLAMLAERIRDTVEKNQPEQLRLASLVTVSVGGAIAQQSFDEKGWEDTLGRSDRALYHAKASGRNMFKIFEDFNLASAPKLQH